MSSRVEVGMEVLQLYITEEEVEVKVEEHMEVLQFHITEDMEEEEDKEVEGDQCNLLNRRKHNHRRNRRRR
jgi:hypothetical protein